MMKKKGCLWSRPGELYQPWCSVGLRCHKTDHIHFWNLFQALGNRSGQGTRHYLHFFSKEREIVPCLLFHIVDFAKAIFLIFLGNIEILWWHIHGLFSLAYLISFSKGKFLHKAHCFWHCWRWRLLILFILFVTRFSDILSSFSWQYVSLAILPIGYKVHLRTSTLSIIFLVVFLSFLLQFPTLV